MLRGPRRLLSSMDYQLGAPPGSPQPPGALNLPGGLRERGSSAGAGNHPRGLVTSVKAAGLRGDTGTR